MNHDESVDSVATDEDMKTPLAKSSIIAWTLVGVAYGTYAYGKISRRLAERKFEKENPKTEK